MSYNQNMGRGSACLTHSGLVIRNSIIYYGYKQALSHLPPKDLKAKEQKEKWAKMRRPKPAIPDDWVGAVSCTLLFLTCLSASRTLTEPTLDFTSLALPGRAVVAGLETH